MIPERKLCHERQKQAELCIAHQQYRTGAETMLILKETFNLRGDFSDMEQIQAEVSRKSENILYKYDLLLFTFYVVQNYDVVLDQFSVIVLY